MNKKVVVLGLGNILMKDEGVGVQVVKELENKQLPENTEVIDGGTASLDILLSLQNIKKLVIIDALKAEGKPGTVYRLKPDDLSSESNRNISLHQINLLDTLGIIKRMNNLPEIIEIIGIEPEEIKLGLELSPKIKKIIPDIVDLIIKEINHDSN